MLSMEFQVRKMEMMNNQSKSKDRLTIHCDAIHAVCIHGLVVDLWWSEQATGYSK